MPPVSFERRHRQFGDLALCDSILREGSKSFHAASRLLPPRVRAPAAALYAFCRCADDAVDIAEDPAVRIPVLRSRLARVYAGTPDQHPVDRTLADVVAAYDIPRAILEALFEGLAWDAEGRTYDTFEDVEAYATRVAATVGVMMTLVMGVRSPVALARACNLGIAMQLTNICRDVGEDARNQRLYLPRSWLREAGIDPDGFLAKPVSSPALRRVVERMLAMAETHYARGRLGIAALPSDCRPAIRAAGAIYAEIGRRILRDGIDPMTERAVVPAARKLALVAAAALPGRRDAPLSDAPAPVTARFLLAAIRPESAAASPRPRRTAIEKAIWVVELMDRVERRKRGLEARSPG
jgi:phytoene synthase